MNTATHIALDLPDYTAIKEKQQAAWGSGDYGKIGITLQITGESLCEAMDLHAGQTVLDVAAGNGNVTMAAARRFCSVISTDYVEHLLEQSRTRANIEGLPVEFQQADAENLPFPDNHFDNVVSTFGVMFTPNQSQAARELIRVCKPGGKIGLANWTPEGFIGQLFKTIGQYAPPPAGVHSPALWGADEFLKINFQRETRSISYSVKQFNFRYKSPQHFVDLFRTYYGPVHKAFLATDADKAAALEADIVNLIDKFNRAKDGTMIVPSDYLEIVITK
jgi:ubiquinone/menaquinone biosynthesis C-methylase UbiE